MTISITDKHGKTKVFEDDDKRSAGEKLYNYAIKHKSEWFITKKTKKKGK